METIKPYQKINDALLSLDNGGRFYNLLTKAEDGIISQAELGKVGGVFGDKQKMILFLELSISRLTLSEKEAIIFKLDEKLKDAYLKYQPKNLLPSEVNEQGILSSNVILTGVPKLVESKSDFFGFIMIPIMVGNATIFSMIPLMDDYDVYELRDEQSSETFTIAHSKGSGRLPNKKIVVAGVLKELKSSEEEKNASKKFLEAIYHLDLD
jgi:hypothetical protein